MNEWSFIRIHKFSVHPYYKNIYDIYYCSEMDKGSENPTYSK